MPRRPKGVCVFCDSPGPLTDEHALQNWAREVLGIKGRVTINRGGKVIAERRRLNVIAPQALCVDCNGVWLGPVEDKFKALMGPTLNGKGPIYLDAVEQEFVGLWVVKSALLLELAMRFTSPGHFCPVPSSAFRWLWLHKTPPPRATAWIGATGPQTGEEPRAAYFSNQPVAPPVGQKLVGNVITFVYGNLLLKAFVVDVPDGPLPPGITAPDIDPLAQVWPVRHERVGWPPPRGVTYTDLDNFNFMRWPLSNRLEPKPPFEPDEPPEGFE
jgi:hypothetical protein